MLPVLFLIDNGGELQTAEQIWKRHKYRMFIIARKILNSDADIVCLQEIGGFGAAINRKKLKQDVYPYVMMDKGMACLSKYPILSKKNARSGHIVRSCTSAPPMLGMCRKMSKTLVDTAASLWTVGVSRLHHTCCFPSL